MAIAIGIDPGATGAIAFLDGDSQYVFDFGDDGFKEALRYYAGMVGCIALIETQSPHKQAGKKNDDGSDKWQGAISSGRLMTNYGRWKGRLDMVGIGFKEVYAATWRAALCKGHPLYRVKGRSKDLSLEMARKFFPGMEKHLKRKRDNGRADALLIALYAKKFLTK